jgi:hypothetical protein
MMEQDNRMKCYFTTNMDSITVIFYVIILNYGAVY